MLLREDDGLELVMGAPEPTAVVASVRRRRVLEAQTNHARGAAIGPVGIESNRMSGSGHGSERERWLARRLVLAGGEPGPSLRRRFPGHVHPLFPIPCR